MFDNSLTWSEANEYCNSIGGHLVTIEDLAEQQIITQMLNARGKNKNCYWIGLQKNDNNWNWVDGTDFNYTNWAPNEPNNTDGKEPYVHMFGNVWTGGKGIKNVGQWNDASNEGASYANAFYALSNFGFICEWD